MDKKILIIDTEDSIWQRVLFIGIWVEKEKHCALHGSSYTSPDKFQTLPKMPENDRAAEEKEICANSKIRLETFESY